MDHFSDNVMLVLIILSVFGVSILIIGLIARIESCIKLRKDKKDGHDDDDWSLMR